MKMALSLCFQDLLGCTNICFTLAQIQPGPLWNPVPRSFSKLYLASGVTTGRTTGTFEMQTDTELRDQIDRGEVAGPRLIITAPYITGPATQPLQMRHLPVSNPEAASEMVFFYADSGAQSFKAYAWVTRDQLQAAVGAAHQRGLTLTGHICSVTWKDAIDLGIDNIEHGLIAGSCSDFVGNKTVDECPQAEVFASIDGLSRDDPKLLELISHLVKNRVRVTSTLSVIEMLIPNRPPMLNQMALDCLTPDAKSRFKMLKDLVNKGQFPYTEEALVKVEYPFERKLFAMNPKLLLGGVDPSGIGGVLAGFGDMRNLELLVEAGFFSDGSTSDLFRKWS